MLAAFARHAREVERILPDGFRIAATTLSSTASANATPSVRPAGPLLKEFQLYRFDPENDEKPYYKSYRVDVNSCVFLLSFCVYLVPPWWVHDGSADVQVWPHDAGRPVQDQR